MKTDGVSVFIKRLNNLGIKVELTGNYPWVYLDAVNGKKVKENYLGNHGFTAFFLTNDKNNPFKITDTKIVFDKIRSMLN